MASKGSRRSTKRQKDDTKQPQTLCLVTQASKSATVEGVITKVSDMLRGQTSRSPYFYALISDSQTSLRAVGFTQDSRAALARFHQSKQTVTISNCEIRRSRNNTLEIIIGRQTQILLSTQQFVFPDSLFNTESRVTTVNNLYDIPELQAATVKIKVVRLLENVTLPSGLQRADFLVADKTGSIKITLWEHNIEKLVLNKSYLLQNILVRSYREEKYISLSKHESTVQPIDNIGEVSTPPGTEESPEGLGTTVSSMTIYNATVLGITELQKFVACVKCQRKLPAPLEFHTIVECPTCDTKQLLTSCLAQYFAKLTIRITDATTSTTEVVSVKAFDTTIRRILEDQQSDEVTPETLLHACSFRCRLQDDVLLYTGHIKPED